MHSNSALKFAPLVIDLAYLYAGQDIEKAKFWLKQAELHNCRVIYDSRLES
jgi:hypothetical protein